VFRGAAKVTLDDKGRLVLPARYRERFIDRSGGQLVVTVDRAELCLVLYPLIDWEPVEAQLMALPALNDEARQLQRLIVGHATDLALDGHGRILLTQELREFAGLQRQGMLIGQGNRCELWDETRWLERRDGWFKEKPDPTVRPAQLETLSF
jgi:MraZ protein